MGIAPSSIKWEVCAQHPFGNKGEGFARHPLGIMGEGLTMVSVE